jgi:hypothetical protein
MIYGHTINTMDGSGRICIGDDLFVQAPVQPVKYIPVPERPVAPAVRQNMRAGEALHAIDAAVSMSPNQAAAVILATVDSVFGPKQERAY